MAVTAEITSGPFTVGQRCDLEIAIIPGRALRAGDAVEVQLPNSWLLISGPSFTRKVQTTDPQGDHYVSCSAAGARLDLTIAPRNWFFPEGSARHGRLFTARVVEGELAPDARVLVTMAHTIAPYVSGEEEVYVRVNGEAPASPPRIAVEPGPATSFRVIAPSAARPGEPFDVLLVSLDRFENRSSTRYGGRRLELADGRVIADGLSFTGSVRVSVTLAAEGVCRFRMDETLSNAVRVAADARGPFWGDIHIHSTCSGDGMGSDPMGYARDVSGLDFACTADHSESLGTAGYEQLLRWAREATADGRFVAMLGDERNPAGWSGHHNVYFRDEQAFLACRLRPGCDPYKDARPSGESMQAILADPDRCMVVPHHTGIAWSRFPKDDSGAAVDWDAAGDDRGLRPIMEIYSHHGQSEVYDPHHILSYEFNRMRNPEKRSNCSVPGPYYAQDYWAAGRRIGVIGSSDEHSGRGGRRHGGIAAVFADALTRADIFDALRSRRCYATTGERILMEFTIDGVAMGQEARRAEGTRLPIRLAVWGTTDLVRVDILRLRVGVDERFCPIESVSPRLDTTGGKKGASIEGVPRPTTDAVVEIEDTVSGPVVYYARVVQEPLTWPAMAWSSPVWIDTD